MTRSSLCALKRLIPCSEECYRCPAEVVHRATALYVPAISLRRDVAAMNRRDYGQVDTAVKVAGDIQAHDDGREAVGKFCS
jgi:hypothetical protein